jgi:hypothetical protein
MAAASNVSLVVVGVVVVLVVIDAAIRTFVVPRGTVVTLSAAIFLGVRQLFRPFAPAGASYEQRDRAMAVYGPFALLSLPAVSILLVFAAYACIFAGLRRDGWSNAFVTSGSSLLTLGFERPPDLPSVFVALSEAAIGLGLVALIIAYLPAIYNVFSRREVLVGDLSIRAGTPPTPAEWLIRAQRTGFLLDMDRYWETWGLWYTEVQETHTSYGALAFFRSPNPNRHWVTAAGVVLDTASIRLAVCDIPWTAAAPLCIRSGYVALREIAAFFGYEFDDDPKPDHPISIAREEFDEIYDRLAAVGVPVHADRDRAWRDFAGWRVNYDQVLLALAALVDAPYTPWISDRSPVRPARRYRLGRRRHEIARGRMTPP